MPLHILDLIETLSWKNNSFKLITKTNVERRAKKFISPYETKILSVISRYTIKQTDRCAKNKRIEFFYAHKRDVFSSKNLDIASTVFYQNTVQLREVIAIIYTIAPLAKSHGHNLCL